MHVGLHAITCRALWVQQPQNFRNLLSADKFELYQFPSVKHASLNMTFHLALKKFHSENTQNMDIQKSATKVLEIMHGSIDLSELYPKIPKLSEKSKNDFSSRWCGGGDRKHVGHVPRSCAPALRRHTFHSCNLQGKFFSYTHTYLELSHEALPIPKHKPRLQPNLQPSRVRKLSGIIGQGERVALLWSSEKLLCTLSQSLWAFADLSLTRIASVSLFASSCPRVVSMQPRLRPNLQPSMQPKPQPSMQPKLQPSLQSNRHNTQWYMQIVLHQKL